MKIKISEKVYHKIAQYGCVWGVLCGVILFAMMEIANRNKEWLHMGWQIICVNVGIYFALILMVRILIRGGGGELAAEYGVFYLR